MNYPCKHSVTRYCRICEDGYSLPISNPKRKKILSTPINFDRLARAFEAAKHRHWDGYPTAETLRRLAEHGIKDLQKRTGLRDVCNCGGIDVERVNGNIEVLVSDTIMAYYSGSYSTIQTQ